MLLRLLFGEQQGLPSILKEPPAAVVTTTVLYFVLVRIPHAVTCEQLHFVRGYCTVPEPIVITTGAFIVVAAGID